MINWPKYLPIKFRQANRNEPVTGPDFKKARPVKLEFDGNCIELRLPQHRTMGRESAICQRSSNDQSWFDRLDGSAANDHWCYRTLVQRWWGYLYPWFGGEKGALVGMVSVLKRKADKALKHSQFLYPRGFEQALCNFLDTQYGARVSSEGIASSRGPICWKRRTDLAVEAVEFSIEGYAKGYFLMFPISNKHLIEISFSHAGVDDEMQAQTDLLIRQILDSVKITLNAETQAKIDKIRQENPGVTLPETFAPLKWPVDAKGIE